jgi:hypothetical protein
MRNRVGGLLLIVACAAALLAACGGDDDDSGALGGSSSKSTLAPSDTGDTSGGGDTKSKNEWLDAPGQVQFYNYLVDRGKEVPIDLYWYGTETVDGFREVQHSEKFASLAYGEKTKLMTSRYFGEKNAEVEKLEYFAVPKGTVVKEQAENKEVAEGSVLTKDLPLMITDLYNSHSDETTKYLNDGKTVVVFVLGGQNGGPDTPEARPRVQSFYADLYPSGEVNFPPAKDELPQAGAGELVLPVGFIFGTDLAPNSGPLKDFFDWRWSADGTCLPEEGTNSYGGDGEDWMWAVSKTATIEIHPTFAATDTCNQPAVGGSISLAGSKQPFALIVPTATGDPKLTLIEIP